MKAFVATAYGPPSVLELQQVDTPTPKDDEVLVKMVATTVTSADWRVRSLILPTGFRMIGPLVLGFGRPRNRILGTELAGVIEAVGIAVARFKVGDEVFAFSGAAMGCHAEYKVVRESGAIALKPKSLSFDEAAAISFGGTTALAFLRWGGLKAGQRILIVGASGGVGTAAVQLAKHFGAEVTAVCSTANLELVRSIGADHVTDYTKSDFADGEEKYDIIMDTTGSVTYARSKDSLAEDGRLLLVVGGLPTMLHAPWVALTSKHKVISRPVRGDAADLRFLAELAEAGGFRPVIDRRYTFDQMVEAHAYVDQGRKKGNVVITLAPTGL